MSSTDNLEICPETRTADLAAMPEDVEVKTNMGVLLSTAGRGTDLVQRLSARGVLTWDDQQNRFVLDIPVVDSFLNVIEMLRQTFGELRRAGNRFDVHDLPAAEHVCEMNARMVRLEKVADALHLTKED